MQLLLIACLVAAAFAEPESNPALLYNSFYNYPGYASAYSTPYAYNYNQYASPYYPGVYNYGYPYNRFFAKRSADSEPEAKAEAEADPALVYTNGIYNPYTTYAATYANHAVAYAAPAVAYAAQPAYTYAAAPVVAKTAVTYAAAPAVVNTAYTTPYHYVAKREAEAEADPAILYSNYGYNYGPYAAYAAPRFYNSQFYNGIYRSPYAYNNAYNFYGRYYY